MAINREEEKVVFLTFDDGPSRNNTPKILDILKENDVYGTFFVVGYKTENNPNLVKKLRDSGMCILPHSYSHNYKELYGSVDSFMKDLEKCTNAIEDVTGEKIPKIFRFPGGSDNRVSNLNTLKDIRATVKDKGYRYVDWNISSEDATAYKVARSKIVNSVVRESRGVGMCVVLMHDAEAKDTTVEALPQIIKNFKDKGYVFKTFDEATENDIKRMELGRIINRE
ncbi:polysaccharide deacetylase family protein [Clostridium sp.]|uniref:polysaccharide deacetylase family protein n=1 Tax=Clostridium sp. TaxID=1506 RepID=UPI003463A9A7